MILGWTESTVDEQSLRKDAWKHWVGSVPHSGTRTLVKHLDSQGVPLVRRGKTISWYHFNPNDRDMKKPDVFVHIPIRWPLDVAKSWALRDKTGKVLSGLLKAYESMFRFLGNENYSDRRKLYRIEDLPVLEGKFVPGQQEGRYVHNPAEFQKAVMTEVVTPHIEFFERFYPDADYSIR